MDERLNDLVEDLEISVRAWNILHQAGIVYVGELVQWSAEDLLDRPSSSKKIVDELREFVTGMGLALGTELPEWQRPDGAPVARP
ncbi:RNA polymerase, alpha chain C terminal domain [Nannocystis exedens]|uniref:RNA polymerase, alpha chain C terminal domain n=1 Tax=Nannocystis exedens TaxID=54 RepID=A0A1I2GN11_9BACT|nr:DNA-directed RNA polymerase subunit alpha C-terminal domain-containing protein [Nannocystis exedens]PCC73650.1 DNA-directed RNA polymerase subunit alpha [Nannocystis exedens]SFF18399.1 RNA polymerase, alpha chain C terminal domain [Nannocystis exedens]